MRDSLSIPLHQQKAYKNLGYKKGDFPVSEKVSEEIISIPIFPMITKEERFRVINTLKRFFLASAA